jgi:uncharacterized membrane protein YhaH (DUF805 family)
MADFYYLDGARNQQGPVPGEEVARLIRGGTIRRDTMVWSAGMPEWRPAGQVDELASLFAQTPPPRPSVPPPAFPAAPPMQRMVPNAGAYQGQPRPAQAAAAQYNAAKSMGFGGAIATCFRKYVDFTGRATRPEYWFFVLFYTLVVIVLVTIDLIIFGPENGILPLTWLAALVFFLPLLAVAVRRLHDQDRSGWMILLYFIPLAGPIIFIVLMCLRGTPGENRFGPEPGAASLAETFS